MSASPLFGSRPPSRWSLHAFDDPFIGDNKSNVIDGNDGNNQLIGKQGSALDTSHFFLSGDPSGPAPGQEALIYDKAAGVLSYDSNVGDGLVPVEVAHLKPNTELTKDDFVFLS